MLEHELAQHFKLDSQLASVVHVFSHEFSFIEDFSGQAPCFFA